MYKNLKILAIVPARGGSKGLPNKNILPLAGHPLIAYSIEAGKQSKYIDRVLVTTDSEAIAEASRKYGADVPFMRPAHLAADLSTDVEAFMHALQWLDDNENYRPDIIVQLRPTSPIRFAEEIDQCIERLVDTPDATAIRAVTLSPNTPYKMWRLGTSETDFMQPLLSVDGIPEPYNEPRQNLPKVYWQTGTLDMFRREVLMENKSMTGRKLLPYVMDSALAIDIDEIESFRKAEALLPKLNCIKFKE
jgi:N-acylneuraminate cytidylyltransferase